MKRVTTLNLEAELVAKEKELNVNLSAEVNTFLKQRFAKPPEPEPEPEESDFERNKRESEAAFKILEDERAEKVLLLEKYRRYLATKHDDFGPLDDASLERVQRIIEQLEKESNIIKK